MKTLIEQQELRELSQMDRGISRYYAESEAQGIAEVKAGRSLVYTLMQAIMPEIEANVKSLEQGEVRPQRVPVAYHYLTGLRSDAVAYLTAKTVINAAGSRQKLTRTAMLVANLIAEDYQFEELEQAEPNLANSMSRKAARWSRSSTRRKIMRKAASVAGIKHMGWTEGERIKLGMALIELCELQGAVQVLQVSEGTDARVKLIELTDEWKERLKMRHEFFEEERPINEPMICPPKPWTSPISGGYLTPRMQQDIVRGIRYQRSGQAYRDELFSHDLKEVYDAVNRIQATPWRVNNPLLEVLVESWTTGSLIAGLPEPDDMPVPECPPSVDRKLKVKDMDEKMKATFDEWKGRAREVHEYNAKLRSKRVSLMTKLGTARDLKDYEAIYFPHSLDFRGRLYPLTAELSPQSDDVAKALLEFSEGKALGESGGFWLCVHLANLYGNDKVSFEDRVLWAQMNHDHIMRSAQRPLDYLWWTDADEPWCFLAACFEYAAWQVQGDSYISHLPIHMDGSCSGIQHFSAMLRDAEGGSAVNLRAADAPADIYTEVLEVTKRKLSESSEPLHKVWLDKVDRKMVKRPCMTFAYSVTSIGIRDQIIDEMRKRVDGEFLPGTSNFDAGRSLAPLVEESIREVVDRAAEAMDWLKGCSKVLSGNDQATRWTTPLGFPVLQPYHKSVGKLFKVWYKGERIRLTLQVESDKIDGRKQASSVAPNFVHSLDATHLMMVVNRLGEEGITESFAMIHDSFGVHAADIDELHYAIRDEFIKLYTEDIVQQTQRNFFLQLPGNLWKELPDEPDRGELNLEEVRDADFFFA